MSKTKLGIIGCGNISGAYFNATKRFQNIEVVACADMDVSRAEAKAKEFGISKGYSVKELLADKEVELVINLTIPKAHCEIALAALESGKHVHSEKPFGIEREEGKKVIALAEKKKLRVGCAPDTFLGGGHQTCRKLIDDGSIGKPLAAVGFMMSHGPEQWHPDPEFFYKPGGGPMFDMGPYYVTAMVNMLGPVKKVTGITHNGIPERTIGSGTKKGQKIKVEVETYVAGVLEFHNGAIGTLITSFETWGANLPRIEIYGTEASLSVPDPNGFGGPVKIKRPEYKDWVEVNLTHGYNDNFRGIGAADMAVGIKTGRKHRTSGALAFHVLDVMEAFHDASRTGKHVEIQSTCERPAMLPTGLKEGMLDD